MKIGPAVVVLGCAASPVSAQMLHPSASASVVSARVRSTVPGGTANGTGLLGEGSLALGRLSLVVSYLQGTLNPPATPGTGASRDLVEGTVLLGVHPTDWLTLAVGPHARAYTLSNGGGTQRWLFWELRARAATPFVGTAVRGYAELWRTVAGDANVPEPFSHATGGEAGMIMHLARSPLDARVAYRIDNAVLQGRTETVDGVLLGVGVSWH